MQKPIAVSVSRCRQACQQGVSEKSTLAVAAASMQATPSFPGAQSYLHLSVSSCTSITMNPKFQVPNNQQLSSSEEGELCYAQFRSSAIMAMPLPEIQRCRSDFTSARTGTEHCSHSYVLGTAQTATLRMDETL